MTAEQVRELLAVLEVRERLITELAIFAGMRPGEIFGLKWARLETDYADIQQRVYRDDIDSPKSARSVPWAALSDGLLEEFGVGAREGQPRTEADLPFLIRPQSSTRHTKRPGWLCLGRLSSVPRSSRASA